MSAIVIMGLIGCCGFLCQWLAWKSKQPAILYLLLVGMLLGPVTGWLVPEDYFGDLLFPIVSIAVAIILFEGALTLRLSELREIAKPVVKMVSWGALLTAVITAAATHYILDFNWGLSALFGAIMVVTGPTVIIPILRVAKPTKRVNRILRWEGIVIDPIGALFAVLVFEWILLDSHGDQSFFSIGLTFLKTVGLGCIVGIVTGYVFGILLRRHWIPEYLQNYAAVTFVVFAQVFSNSLAHESGLLAVTIMGIWLTNMPGVHTRNILAFKENLTLILVSLLFIVLAARIDFNGLYQLGIGAVLVMLVIQFIARPLKVLLCLWGSPLSLNERLAVSWIGPRGIVAAAVSALFAIKLQAEGFPGAEYLVPLSFSVIMGTVIIQSLTATTVCKLLKVRKPNAHGHLIIGANRIAIEIGKALQESGAQVLLCDTSWFDIKKARLEGLNCYYGNPCSHHADIYLDVSDYSCMLGLDYFSDTNASAALRFREEFGIRGIFTLQSKNGDQQNWKHGTSSIYTGRLLFDEGISYTQISQALNNGEKIRKTTLSDVYSYEDWLEHGSNERAEILFVIDEKGKVRWNTVDNELKPQTGWTIYSINITNE